MLACVDVDYRTSGAVAACLLFREWSDASGTDSMIAVLPSVEHYIPGRFYWRELPCILRVLDLAPKSLDALIIDGYVWLGDELTPGLGAHVFQALKGRTPVVGVAKRYFRGARPAEVLRGRSRRPLYVTAAGLAAQAAADLVGRMHGDSRIPTLLKLVDQLARSHPGALPRPSDPVPAGRLSMVQRAGSKQDWRRNQ
jgi:deoxyribonuclease V